MKIKYNDNELLYMISENEEFAFELLCEKYYPLIINRLNRFKIKGKNYEDFYQECLMVLYRCSLNYREDISYTFNKYFDISLQYRIQNLLRENSKYFYGVTLMDLEKIDVCCNKRGNTLNENVRTYKVYPKNDLENRIVNDYKSGKTIKEISLDIKRNYYYVYRVINRLMISTNKNNLEVGTEVLSVLSKMEKTVYKYSIRGFKPKDIASDLNVDVTSVYSALKRIKQKIKNTK